MTAAPGIPELEGFVWRGSLLPQGGDISPRHKSPTIPHGISSEAWSGHP
ncbi:hypothetical protein SAMN05216504_3854 [Pseudomonas sp. A214]|nr:hypothetical protein SAMN05216504_3854 [Pseudomonas sp. A214]